MIVKALPDTGADTPCFSQTSGIFYGSLPPPEVSSKGRAVEGLVRMLPITTNNTRQDEIFDGRTGGWRVTQSRASTIGNSLTVTMKMTSGMVIGDNEASSTSLPRASRIYCLGVTFLNRPRSRKVSPAHAGVQCVATTGILVQALAASSKYSSRARALPIFHVTR